MTSDPSSRAAFDAICHRQHGVVTAATAASYLGEAGVRWKISRGQWQRPCAGVLVTHSGPLTGLQSLWVAVLSSGENAVLAGLTAARLDGLTGFEDRRIRVLVPAGRQVRRERPASVTVRRSTLLGPADVHPLRLPPRTRLARSLVDAAAWMGTDNGARAVLAAGVQQRLVRAEDLTRVLQRRPGLHRRTVISTTLADVVAGAEALSELDFCRLARRYRLPEPDRQVVRRDSAGRRRWLDAYWDDARLVVEIDGLWHMDAITWWADMRRDNELTVTGHRVLRFPAFVLREQPGVVADQIMRALGRTLAG